ncbi:hypothetical protein BDZ91DRAFT_725321 [Kalaharituber pfeilii]|nr:hypothetical protein BDZ91DRAFT_725321 [Kalaharituber pfeilii]
MSNPDLNSEVARLLQILTSNTGAALPALQPQTQQQQQHLLPGFQQQQLQSLPPQATWTAHQASFTQQSLSQSQTPDPRLAAYAQFPGLSTALQQQVEDPRSSSKAPPDQPIPQTQQQQTKVDPATITQWPAALRFVTTHIARDEAVMGKLRKMKKNQKDNEVAWHNSRQELIKKHKARIEGSKQVDDLLRGFGSYSARTSSACSFDEKDMAEKEASELHQFDLKVHKAATAMVQAMSHELSMLGIPFFCGGAGGTVRVDGEYGIEEGELRELRKRMMELLEDLIGDE